MLHGLTRIHIKLWFISKAMEHTKVKSKILKDKGYCVGGNGNFFKHSRSVTQYLFGRRIMKKSIILKRLGENQINIHLSRMNTTSGIRALFLNNGLGRMSHYVSYKINPVSIKVVPLHEFFVMIIIQDVCKWIKSPQLASR